MPPIYFRAFRSRGVYANMAVFQQVINNEMLRRIDPVIERALQARCEGWKQAPSFDGTVGITSRGITHYISPRGPGTARWTLVSRGVKEHWIEVKHAFGYRPGAKRAPHLSIQRYAPFTMPNGYYGGLGTRFGPVGYRRAVFWPGIAPRNFEAHVAAELRDWYYKEMGNILRVAVRAAQRAGR